MALGLLACGPTAETGSTLALVDVTLVDVDEGGLRPGTTILVRDGTITAVGPVEEVAVPRRATRVEGKSRYVIPGLWDMHTHAHRANRAAWHYPLYVLHGITGVRDLGTFADSALSARQRWKDTDLAPRVWWGSPPLDGAPPALSFGVAVTSAERARDEVRRLHARGFRFIKVYDRLDRASYLSLTAEARRLGIPVEGHVPLQLDPASAVAAGQRTIEHLTLVLESCIPGALDWIAADSSRDAMGLLSDGRLAASLERYDPSRCARLFGRLSAAGVWQVPTLVQMRGAWMSKDSAFAADPRLALVPREVADDWFAYRAETSPQVFDAGMAVYRRQLQLVGEMHRAGVPFLAGTDASDEPWVFPGASLHDELALFVAAGFRPVDALRTATTNAAKYRGETAPLLAPGRVADMVILAGDPLKDIEQVRAIEGVILRGRYLNTEALQQLRERLGRPPQQAWAGARPGAGG